MVLKQTDNLTPMMEQYLAIKSQYEHALLFYQMGDFYEMFFDDAIAAAEALDIALTKRGKTNKTDIPMCGVPVHSADHYLQMLIRKGFRVAVCVQTETPAEAKSRGHKAVVQREVIRLITPGTLTEDSLLDAKKPNYIAAVHNIRNLFSLAWADISSGELHVCNFPQVKLAPQLARISPNEILYPESLPAQIISTLQENCESLTPFTDIHFDSQAGKKRIHDLFKVSSLDAFGNIKRSDCASIGALIAYIEMTQQGKLPVLQPPQCERHEHAMQIDTATWKNLEIIHNLSGERSNTLISVLDDTLTAGGARLLEKWLKTPTTNIGIITKRQNEVKLFLAHADFRSRLRTKLRKIPDLHRSLSRLGLERGSPRDMKAIQTGLTQALSVRNDVLSLELLSEARKVEMDVILSLKDMSMELQDALVDQPPITTKEGGYIKKGYNEELDEIRLLRDQARHFIAELEKKYIKLTGISSLKIRFNNMLSYYIETPSSYFEKMATEPLSDIFIHRQSTVNKARFNTQELSELQTKIFNAELNKITLEQSLFDSFRHDILNQSAAILAVGQTISELDVIGSMAEIAANNNWCQPILNDDIAIDIRSGRHPVVEKSLAREGHNPFIANDCQLKHDSRITLLTGPNMAGKSTYLRQNALIVLLAQIGSYVPAKEAKIGIVSQLYSRVGAADDLARGRSTFMVEMIETAAILNTADSRALVILDEVGRGTATYDGLSIAWATLEYLHNKINCRTLFATHYHELTHLSDKLKRITNATVRVKEWEGDVIFLHEVVDGIASRSYGIQVAQLAGLPKPVINRANFILDRLENEQEKPKGINFDLPLFAPLFEEVPPPEPEITALEEKIKEVNPDNLTPIGALQLIYELKELNTKN